MAHRIDTEFAARVIQGRIAPQFQVSREQDGIAVLGGLSTGKGRWSLSASAVRHRRRITLQVLARPVAEGADTDEVLDHAYRALLRGLTPGAYHLRVTHVFHAPELGLSSEGLAAWEAMLEVRRDDEGRLDVER